MYSVYIIYSSKLDRYYVGYSEDVQKRLAQHNAGLSDFTAKAADWIIKYQKQYASRAEAQKAELSIKNKKSRKYIEWLIEAGFRFFILTKVIATGSISTSAGKQC